jgi:hypothetical protein
LLDQVPTAATLESIHGQSGFCLTVPTAVTWTKAGTGCSGDVTSTSVCFQLGTLKAGPAPGGTAVVASTDVLVKALWNDSLISTDGSFGIHNPTWVLNVLRATYDAVFARP